jgi:hypothetical protein
MPNVQSEPGRVHESGSEDDSSVGELAPVHGEELDEPENLICGVVSTLMTEHGRIKVHCTMGKKPRHVHYDEIFSKEWQ